MSDVNTPPSRRDAIRHTLTATAAAGLSIEALAEAREKRLALQKDARPVKCAFVGVGSQGTADLKAALTVPGVEFTAICDIYEPNMERALKLCPKAKGYKDYRAVMDLKDVEAVLIATPLYMHAPVALASLDAGKPTFCEKMMAYSIEDAKKMARMSRDKKVLLQVGHQRRSNIVYNHGWELINKAKVCGPITHIRAQWNRNGGKRETWQRPVPPDTNHKHWCWRLYREYSQGLIAELGTHQIHVANWYLGTAPTAVVGIGGIDFWKDGREVFDNIEVIYEYPNGVKLNYTSITTNQYDGFYEQFMGRDGTLVVGQELGGQYYREPSAELEDWMKASATKQTGPGGKVSLKLDPEATKKLTAKTGQKVGEKVINSSVAGKTDYVLEMEDFIDSVRTGAPVSCGWQDGLACTVAAVRANEAMDKKQRIEIPASDYQL